MKCSCKGVRLPACRLTKQAAGKGGRCVAIPVSGQCLDGQGAQITEVVSRSADALASRQIEGDKEQRARVTQTDAAEVGSQTEELTSEVGTQGGCVRRAAVTAALRSVEPQGVGVENRKCARFVGRRSVADRQSCVGKFVML